MDTDTALSLISSLSLIATFFLLVRLRRMKVVYILDYQTGLRFRDGAPCSVLAYGSHLTSATQNLINVVDLRPNHFIFERITFQDALHANSVLSVGGELIVSDPQLAVSTLKNLVDDSLTIVRDGLRVAASRTIADTSTEGRAKLASVISTEVNRELDPRGVKIQNIEITELWAQPMPYSIPAGTN